MTPILLSVGSTTLSSRVVTQHSRLPSTLANSSSRRPLTPRRRLARLIRSEHPCTPTEYTSSPEPNSHPTYEPSHQRAPPLLPRAIRVSERPGPHPFDARTRGLVRVRPTRRRPRGYPTTTRLAIPISKLPIHSDDPIDHPIRLPSGTLPYFPASGQLLPYHLGREQD